MLNSGSPDFEQVWSLKSINQFNVFLCQAGIVRRLSLIIKIIGKGGFIGDVFKQSEEYLSIEISFTVSSEQVQLPVMRKIFILLALALSVSLISRSQVVSTTTGGNWSDPATWVGASIPTPTDQVIIADGANVVIDVNATVLGLTVGQGSGGLLRFQAMGSVTLTVSSDILINPGATFRTSLTGTETGHELVAGGNLINNGILDFSNNGNAATAAIRFTGAANAIMGGTGTVTDVDRITIDKGNSVGSVLNLIHPFLPCTGLRQYTCIIRRISDHH